MRSKKAIINIISALILQVVTIICGFIVPRLIIGSFGSSVNGLVVSITQFLAYITLLESGFGPVVKSVLYKPIAENDKNTIEEILKTSEKFFRKIAYIFLAYILVLAIVMPNVVSSEFDTLFTLSLVVIIAISTFAEYYFGMTYNLFLQAKQRKYVVSSIKISTLILNTIAIIVLIKLGASIQIVKLVSGLIFVLRPVLQNIYVRRKYNINLKNAKGNFDIIQKWDGLAQHIAYVIHEKTDIVLLTLCTNIVEVSVYSVYLMITNSIKNIITSFSSGLDASFGDMIAKDENEVLNKRFRTFENIYYTISTIVFVSSVFLILPFVKLYTNGITDANYIRPVFAYLMVAIKFIEVIKNPYNELIKAAGHFKETRNGAWLEAISNIAISLIFIWQFGIVGVAIGTIVSLVLRTLELMWYSSKNVLKRSNLEILKRLVLVIIEVIAIVLIMKVIPNILVDNYLMWIGQGIMLVVISSIVVCTINFLVYRKDVKDTFLMMKNIIKKEK